MPKKMVFTGEKESFITRVLIKKVQDSGIDCSFVHCTVDEINKTWEESQLLTLYLDDDTEIKDDVLHFLSDNMYEKGVHMILIGEQTGIDYAKEYIPKELIYRVFTRPVDNAAFVEAVSEFFTKLDAGEFRKSILIVDDDPQYLSLVREWLRGTYKVLMANSGLQAIKYLGKNKVDLILLDYEMPVTTGPKVLEMLRSEPGTSDIPVMFLTNKSDKESVMGVISLKPEKYLLKTMPPGELVASIDEFFEKQRLKSFM